jgi:hypothetical protein
MAPLDEQQMAFPHQISVFSPELVSFHEAGHVAVAIGVGAIVRRCILSEAGGLHGVTSTRHSAEQAPLIACGGAAAEYNLLKKGRLFSAGRPAHAGDLVAALQENAAIDAEIYSRAIEFLKGHPPSDSFDDLLGHAFTDVYKNIDFALVEKLAELLLDKRELTEANVVAAVGRSQGPSFQTDYRMHRMHGHWPLKALQRALTDRTQLTGGPTPS